MTEIDGTVLLYMYICISDIFVGLRLLDATTDINEALALSYANDIIDVYSNSWGPSDSGNIVSGPEMLTRMALRNGANEVSQTVKYKWSDESIKNQLLPLHVYYCTKLE